MFNTTYFLLTTKYFWSTVFNTAYFDVENVPGKSNANVGISVDTTSFNLERDVYDVTDGSDDNDAPYAKMDEPKVHGEEKDANGSRLPIRNVLDVFQELKLAFGRSWKR